MRSGDGGCYGCLCSQWRTSLPWGAWVRCDAGKPVGRAAQLPGVPGCAVFVISRFGLVRKIAIDTPAKRFGCGGWACSVLALGRGVVAHPPQSLCL
jgi:hypothetical protein